MEIINFIFKWWFLAGFLTYVYLTIMTFFEKPKTKGEQLTINFKEN